MVLSLSAAVSWGTSSILLKVVLETESPLDSLIIRGLFAVPFVALITLLINQFASVMVLFSLKIFPILVVSSMCVTFGDLIFFFALQRIEVSKALPVASIYPLFAAILLTLGGLEELTLMTASGTIVIIVGVGLVAQKANSSEQTAQKQGFLDIGIVLAIIAAVFWSFGILTLRIMFEDPQVETFSLATIRFAILTIFAVFLWVGIFLYEKRAPPRSQPLAATEITKKNIVTLGVSGILSWGIGGVAFFQAMQLIGASRATPISSINPLVGSLLGFIFLKERIGKLQIVGILLVTMGSIIISLGQ
ncbi:MAG: DMT family transporter [Promethearchaeota archaeon]